MSVCRFVGLSEKSVCLCKMKKGAFSLSRGGGWIQDVNTMHVHTQKKILCLLFNFSSQPFCLFVSQWLYSVYVQWRRIRSFWCLVDWSEELSKNIVLFLISLLLHIWSSSLCWYGLNRIYLILISFLNFPCTLIGLVFSSIVYKLIHPLILLTFLYYYQ